MNTDKIFNSLATYGQHFKLTHQFSTEDFLQKMEPIFTQFGCRHGFPQAEPRILVIHNGGVGDFVLFSPCLREIRRIYPHAHITLTIPPATANLAAPCPYIDTLISCEYINASEFNDEIYLWLTDFSRINFSTPFDIAFNFGTYFTGILLAYMSGAKERILYIDQFGWDMWHRIPYQFAQALSTIQAPENILSPHIVDRYLAVMDNLIHLPIKDRELEVWFSEADTRLVKKLLPCSSPSCLVALCMGGIGGIKSYPAEKYATLLQRILKQDKDKYIIIVGGDAEIEAGKFVAQSLPSNHVLNFTGALSYPQTAALLSLCSFYIGNDTGCAHIAAAMKVPSLVVYTYAADLPQNGHSTVETYYPYHVPTVLVQPEKALSPCKPIHSPLGEVFGCTAMQPHCITQVSVDEMYEGWLTLMNITHQA